MPRSCPPYLPGFRRHRVGLVRAGRLPEDLSRGFGPTARLIGIWVAQADRGQAEGGAACRPDHGGARRVGPAAALGCGAWLRRPPPAYAVLGAGEAGPNRPRHLAPNVWGATRLRRVAGRKGKARPQARRLPDVRRRRSRNGLRRAGRRLPPPRQPNRDAARDKDARPAPGLANRDLAAAGPNQVWGAGTTRLPTAAGFLSLAVVPDAWRRKPNAERQFRANRSEVSQGKPPAGRAGAGCA